MRSRYESAALHSLGWLAGANLVGLWMATLLLAPRLGTLTAPLTYGRWATVHLDGQLYGWCSLPLVALLFKLFAPAQGFDRPARAAYWVWTLSLLVSVAAWLAGISGGKLFMEWSGITRLVFPLNMAVLFVVLTLGYVAQQRDRRDGRPVRAMKVAVLLFLAAIPVVMFWAANPELFPPTNPDSGGATGGSLLGSTLAVVAIIYACPFIIGLTSAKKPFAVVAGVLLAIHFGLFSLMDHGDHSHHEAVQLVGLFSLVVWWPLLTIHLRAFDWPLGTRRWLVVLCAWAAILLVTALFTFLPGVLEAWKFTNALVAHSHIAMAGMMSALNMVVLASLTRSPALDQGRPFWMWNVGCLVLGASLIVLGVFESMSPAVLYRSMPVADTLYGIRWIAGVAMCVASIEWWLRIWRRIP